MKRLFILTVSLFFIVFLIYSCKKEGSFEASQQATGSLQDDASGNCLPKVVQGIYVVGKSLNPDSNYIEVQVNVLTGGSYSITSDTLNGFSFSGSGSFSGAGLNTVRLKGNGAPLTASSSPNNFTIKFYGTYCTVPITVLATGTKAVFTLVTGTGNACTVFAPSGNYAAGTALGATNTVSFDVNVTTPGTYTIATTTVNGYSFTGSGVFSATGQQKVTLTGTGTPAASGTNNFTVTAGSSSCSFPITVTGAGTGGTCGTANGTYTVGTVLGSTNTVTVQHTYATAGSYTVSTNTVTGISFSGSATTTAANSSANITLNGTGTPTAAGTQTFTLNFGDGSTCTFTVVVGSGVVNTDIFPLTQGSYWTYNDLTTSDTAKAVVSGTATLIGNTYQKFVFTDASGSFNRYFRKDASGNYYEAVDTAGFGQSGLKFTQPQFEYLFVKQTLAANATWTSDINVTFNGVPAVLRFVFTCASTSATVTANGKSYSNAYQIKIDVQLGVGGVFQSAVPAGTTLTNYYVKGIGMVKEDDLFFGYDLRYYQVI